MPASRRRRPAARAALATLVAMAELDLPELDLLSVPDTLPGRMGITITEASPERVVGSMPVAGNTQLLGLLHGGASCVLAETLGSVGATLHAQRLYGAGGQALGIEINATHHKAVRDGTVTGV